MNPLYNQYGNENNFLKQFSDFKRQFQGNPQEAVQQLLNSGRISQEQYNQAVQKANALRKMLGM